MHATAKVAHHSAFHWLLGGQAISAVGGQVTFMALPLIATLMFHASPARMGILSALDNLPYLMFGLFVGTMVDRHRRLNVMLASDVVRAVCVATIPVAFLFGLLSFGQLCVVAFVVGIANIFFDVACQAYLPDIVQKDRLVRSNGALQTANGLAALGAPGLVGVFIGTVGAPLSMLVDAVSYACSAGTLLRVRAMVGTGRQAAQASGSIVSSVREGIRAVRKDGRLIGLGGGSTFVALSMNIAFAVLTYDLTNVFGLDAVGVGLVSLVFAAFAAAGSLSAEPLSRVLATHLLLILGSIWSFLGLVLIAVASMPMFVSSALLTVGAALAGFGIMTHQALSAGLRQRRAPEDLRGRVLGILRFFEWGIMPVGSLIGGFAGEAMGMPAAFCLAAVFAGAALCWVLATTLRTVR